MAENLVGMMASEFEPSEYKDEYKQAVLQLVEAKVQKKEVIEAPEPEAETTVVDLMSALKASVERAKKGEAKTKRASSGIIFTDRAEEGVLGPILGECRHASGSDRRVACIRRSSTSERQRARCLAPSYRCGRGSRGAPSIRPSTSSS